MADSITLSRVARHPRFQDRVDFMLAKAAISVLSESTSTEGHADRVVYAKSVLDGSASVLEHATAALTNATLTAAATLDADDHGISDSDLEFAVNEMWNAMSGVETGGA